MKIRIVNETGITHHTRVLTEDGRDLCQLMPIASIDLELRPQALVKAHVEVDQVLIDAHAELRLPEEDLRALARAHGFNLVRRQIDLDMDMQPKGQA